MIRFFKSLQPATLFLIPIIILFFWIRIIFDAFPIADSKILPLWTAIFFFLNGLPSWLNFILLFGLISAEAIYFNLMLNRHEVHYKNTFLPALIFALFVSCTPALMQFHPVHLVNLLLILIIGRVFTLFKNEFPISALFDCGFMTGIAAMIYFPAVIIIPFLLTTLILLRPFRIKECLITIIGILLPYFFISTYLFWNHQLIPFWKSYFGLFQDIHPQILIERNIKIIVLAISIGIFLILSLLKLRSNYRKNIIRTRTYQQVFLILLIFGISWLFFSENIEIIQFAFLLIPVSVFCSYYFVSAKKGRWIYEYALWALIGVIIWNHLS